MKTEDRKNKVINDNRDKLINMVLKLTSSLDYARNIYDYLMLSYREMGVKELDKEIQKTNMAVLKLQNDLNFFRQKLKKDPDNKAVSDLIKATRKNLKKTAKIAKSLPDDKKRFINDNKKDIAKFEAAMKVYVDKFKNYCASTDKTIELLVDIIDAAVEKSVYHTDKELHIIKYQPKILIPINEYCQDRGFLKKEVMQKIKDGELQSCTMDSGRFIVE